MDLQRRVQHPDVHLVRGVRFVGTNEMLSKATRRVPASLRHRQFFCPARHHVDVLHWHHLQTQAFLYQGNL